jgi:hypothetical protein
MVKYQLNWQPSSTPPETFQATPIVVDGIMYLTQRPNDVVALDAKTGRELWRKEIANNRAAYYTTLAPLIADGRVMVGTSGGETGVRGFVAAFDPDTGRELWRTFTVPAPGEPGSETWPTGDQWKTGGAPVWVTGNYDLETNTSYWGTGNGAPWMGDQRPGDNLYTGSTVAIDVATGKIKGHFQYTPNESFDWDEVSPPILVDFQRNGRTVKGLIDVARNGYLWFLERGTGPIKFVQGVPHVRQTVFRSVDPVTGRPDLDPAHKPGTGKVAEFCPSHWGGKNWPPIAYSPQTRLVYVPANENLCASMEGLPVTYSPGSAFTGARNVMSIVPVAKVPVEASLSVKIASENMPFSLLVTAAPPDNAPDNNASYASAAWLVRRMAVSQVPSPRAFLSLRLAQQNRTAAPMPFLGLGDPLFNGPVAGQALDSLAQGCREAGPMPPAQLRALPPLHDTAVEVNAVARVLGGDASTVLLGANASETSLRSRPLDQFGVLYFATHGLLPGELHCQAEPGLVLSPPAAASPSTDADGLLDASEVAALKLNADLVVLSACNTGAAGGGRFGGGALAGLADAFFNAGARAVLATHWEVPSAATTRLMTGVFQRYGQARASGIAEALRQSQLAMIGTPATAHPFNWAAFTLIGDSASAVTAAGTSQVQQARNGGQPR